MTSQTAAHIQEDKQKGEQGEQEIAEVLPIPTRLHSKRWAIAYCVAAQVEATWPHFNHIARKKTLHVWELEGRGCSTVL